MDIFSIVTQVTMDKTLILCNMLNLILGGATNPSNKWYKLSFYFCKNLVVSVFFQFAKFFRLTKKIWTFLYKVQRKKSILFMHFHTKNWKIFAAIYLFTYYLNLAFWMFKIAESLSYTYKIEHFSRFLGQNSISNMFLDILNRYFKGVFMPKNTFFEGTKKFSVQKIVWDFLYMYKGGLCKKTLLVVPITKYSPFTISWQSTKLKTRYKKLIIPLHIA